MVGEHIRSSFGQPAIVENVAGANGSIGTWRAVRMVTPQAKPQMQSMQSVKHGAWLSQGMSRPLLKNEERRCSP